LRQADFPISALRLQPDLDQPADGFERRRSVSLSSKNAAQIQATNIRSETPRVAHPHNVQPEYVHFPAHRRTRPKTFPQLGELFFKLSPEMQKIIERTVDRLLEQQR
jgi:hypothetical protein